MSFRRRRGFLVSGAARDHDDDLGVVYHAFPFRNGRSFGLAHRSPSGPHLRLFALLFLAGALVLRHLRRFLPIQSRFSGFHFGPFAHLRFPAFLARRRLSVRWWRRRRRRRRKWRWRPGRPFRLQSAGVDDAEYFRHFFGRQSLVFGLLSRHRSPSSSASARPGPAAATTTATTDGLLWHGDGLLGSDGATPRNGVWARDSAPTRTGSPTPHETHHCRVGERVLVSGGRGGGEKERRREKEIIRKYKRKKIGKEDKENIQKLERKEGK